jgi:hypothetical protein
MRKPMIDRISYGLKRTRTQLTPYALSNRAKAGTSSIHVGI